MAASTFERKIVISDPKSLARLEKIVNDNSPKKPISEHPFSRKKGEDLLSRCQLRSSH